jgi:hypothetical protein
MDWRDYRPPTPYPFPYSPRFESSHSSHRPSRSWKPWEPFYTSYKPSRRLYRHVVSRFQGFHEPPDPSRRSHPPRLQRKIDAQNAEIARRPPHFTESIQYHDSVLDSRERSASRRASYKSETAGAGPGRRKVQFELPRKRDYEYERNLSRKFEEMSVNSTRLSPRRCGACGQPLPY